jgi:integrase
MDRRVYGRTRKDNRVNKVHIFNILQRKNKNTRYLVKWRVKGRDKTRSFKNKTAAEAFHRTLKVAADKGSAFDPTTGQPLAWVLNQKTFAECAVEYVALKWNFLAASSRKSLVEALSYSLIHLTNPRNKTVHETQSLSDAARLHILKPNSDEPTDPKVVAAKEWILKNSVQISEVDVKLATELLAKLNRSTVSDRKVAPRSLHRRRQAVNAVFRYAEKQNYREKNPIELAEYTKRAFNETINPKTLPSTTECRSVTKKLKRKGEPGKRTAMFISIIWLAGLRPSEVLALKKKDVIKTAQGDYEIHVSKAAVQVGKSWTETNHAQSVKQPKARAEGHVRVVPVVDELKTLLLPFLEKRKDEDLLFPATKNKGSIILSAIEKVWKENRTTSSTLHDLRHLNATLMIYSGLNVIEVANRLGHSVAVCSRIYAHVMSDFEKTSNQKINTFLQNN